MAEVSVRRSAETYPDEAVVEMQPYETGPDAAVGSHGRAHNVAYNALCLRAAPPVEAHLERNGSCDEAPRMDEK